MSRALMPNLLTPQDLEPNWEWREKIPAWGHTSVDFERRVDHDRLRRYRLAQDASSVAGVERGHATFIRREQHPPMFRQRRLGNGNGIRCAGFAC